MGDLGTQAAYNFYNAITPESLVHPMKFSSHLILSFVALAALSALPLAWAEPEPSPTATPYEEPTPTPHEEPSATPGDDNGGEPGDDDGGNDNGDNGEEGHLSLHGFYEGTTANGGLAVFYIESNTHVQINILDFTAQQIGFAEGTLTNGAFSFSLTSGQAITGNATEERISVTLGDQTFVAEHVSAFGERSAVGGRYVGVAHGPTGESPLMFLIDGNDHIVMVQNAASGRIGGFGTLTAPVAPSLAYTFTLDQFIGSSSPITGTFTLTDGVFSGSFQSSAGDFTVTSFKQSLANHMANISTRGLVGPGQGQMIGGFIITGGPKMVLIRALGPSLSALGVSPVVANPSLQLYSGATLLASNDDWGTNANAADIAASFFAPKNALEAALLVRLEPGAYTTVVSNGDGSTAIALVEVYEMGID
jgi:hypothetical protein